MLTETKPKSVTRRPLPRLLRRTLDNLGPDPLQDETVRLSLFIRTLAALLGHEHPVASLPQVIEWLREEQHFDAETACYLDHDGTWQAEHYGVSYAEHRPGVRVAYDIPFGAGFCILARGNEDVARATRKMLADSERA